MIVTLVTAIASVICANSNKVTAPVHAVLIAAIAFTFAGLEWEANGVASIAIGGAIGGTVGTTLGAIVCDPLNGVDEYPGGPSA